ncbi:MAG TPA: hypothetical protein VHB74_01315, partial [Devosia sp.]|nr:hypothetical protein [Devosia sp.]
ASPKTTLILGAVGFVSLAVQVGSILFGELLSGRALIEPAAGEGTGEEAAHEAPSMLQPEPAATAADLEPALESERVTETERVAREGLRTWFSRRGRDVAAVLGTHEPPVIERAAPNAGAVPEVVIAPDRVEEAASAVGEAVPAVAEDPVLPASEAGSDSAERFANLSADLMLGRARILIVAGVATAREAAAMAEHIVNDALRQGLSVAHVDAGSGRVSLEPGISDLAADEVSYGDVVHEAGDRGLAEIPWGQQKELDLDSAKPVTLIEALSDLYEIVVVAAGRFSPGSAGARFGVLNARLVLAGDGADPAAAEVARGLAAASGYRRIEAIALPPQAEVA